LCVSSGWCRLPQQVKDNSFIGKIEGLSSGFDIKLHLGIKLALVLYEIERQLTVAMQSFLLVGHFRYGGTGNSEQ